MRPSTRKILLIIICLLLVVSFFIVKNIRDKAKARINSTDDNKPSELIRNDSYEIKRITDTTNPYTKIDMSYPVFKLADSKFNNDVKNFIVTRIEDHKTMSQNNWQARYLTTPDKTKINELPSEGEKFYIHSSVEIAQSNPLYISFIIQIDGFEGGAHGYVNIYSYNYDVKSQKTLKLSDIFSKDLDYLKYLSNQSRESLKNKYATISDEDKKSFESSNLEKQYQENIVSMINEGTTETEDNFKTFTFTPEKIKIYFRQYQVVPYVLGMPTLEILRK